MAGHTKMAQTGFTPISLYYTTTAAAAPTAGNLVAGELAINTNDGILYYKDSSGVVQSIASKAGNSGSFTNLAYTGTLTGGTGIVNLGSGQFYKDASGNVGIGTSSPSTFSAYTKLSVLNGVAVGVDASNAGRIVGSTTTGTELSYLSMGGNYNLGSTGEIALATTTAKAMLFGTNSAERMRILSDGKVGINTSSPTQLLSVYKNQNAETSILVRNESTDTAAKAIIRFGNSNSENVGSVGALGAGFTNSGALEADGFYVDAGRQSLNLSASNSGVIKFFGAGTERMRQDSSGNFLVGKTSSGALSTGVQLDPRGYATGVTSNETTGTGPLFYLTNAGSSVANGYRFITFRNTSSFNEIGTVTNNNGTGVLYNITSDYRLKNVIAPVTNSGERLDLLEPIEYDWKSNGIRTKGFLAHKFAEVYPNSVSGEKDAIDKEGKPAYQGMQPSSAEVMADLIAEIQSLRKRVATLESK